MSSLLNWVNYLDFNKIVKNALLPKCAEMPKQIETYLNYFVFVQKIILNFPLTKGIGSAKAQLFV